MRVLVHFVGSGPFVRHVCDAVKSAGADFVFDICDSSRLHDCGQTYEHAFTRPKRLLSRANAVAALEVLGSPHFYRRLYQAAVTGSMGARFAARELRQTLYANACWHSARQRKHDIHHVHYCAPAALAHLACIPKTANVICSFWGSDLLRTSGLYNYWCQLKMIERSSIVTVQTPELKTILLAKFGQQWADRVRYCRFPMDERVFDEIDVFQRDDNGLKRMRESLGLNGREYVIAVGHNGSRYNQHIRVVEALGGMTQAFKEQVVVLFPMSYGYDPSYAAKVDKACVHCGLRAIQLREYYDAARVAALRVVSDCLIYAPVSDALSATVLEAMYAGSKVLAGAWLPYGPYVRLSLPLHFFEDWSMLPRLVGQAFRARDDHDQAESVRLARAVIRREFNKETLGWAWVEAYRAAVSGQK